MSCHGRQSWTGVCQGKLCPDVGEAAPCLMNGFLHVAGAGHLHWFLDQGRRRISVVSTRGQGTCCQGVPRQGSMPASTSSKNQAWNFPEAHFLPFNSVKDLSCRVYLPKLNTGCPQGAEPLRVLPCPCPPLYPHAPPPNTRHMCLPSGVLLPSPPRRDSGLRELPLSLNM